MRPFVLFCSLLATAALMLPETGCDAASPPSARPQWKSDILSYTLDDGGSTAVWAADWNHIVAPRSGATALLLVSGATYDTGSYWSGGSDESYSAAKYFNKQGLDTVVVNMRATTSVGGDWPTPERTARLLDQIAGDLRARYGYGRVVGVGHSIGAAELVYYAGRPAQKLDKLIVTGYTSAPRRLPAIITREALAAVLADPYPKYPDFMRTALFYYKDGSDPTFADYDNVALASPTFRGRLAPAFEVRDDGTIWTRSFAEPEKVRIPVLLLLGDRDVLYPSAGADTDVKLYTATVAISAVQHSSGHSLNFHDSRMAGWDTITDWAKK